MLSLTAMKLCKISSFGILTLRTCTLHANCCSANKLKVNGRTIRDVNELAKCVIVAERVSRSILMIIVQPTK